MPPSNANLAYYYDNVGKYIVPAFRVKGERNSTPTVVTATQCIEMRSPNPSLTDLQTKPTYKTALADSCEADIQVKMLELREEGINDFRNYRYQFICSIFK